MSLAAYATDEHETAYLPVPSRVLPFGMQQLLPVYKCGIAFQPWRPQLDNGLSMMIASDPIFAPRSSLSASQDGSPSITDPIVILDV